MLDLESVAHLLTEHCFAEAAYFGAASAAKVPTALAHMLAGAGCCGCAEPLATAQRLLEGGAVQGEVDSCGLRVSPATDLLYEGFFHLIQAVRLDPVIQAPANLRDEFDAIADNLAYVSRREFHTAPGRRRRYSLRLASISAAVLLRRLTGSDSELPGVMSPLLESAAEIIKTELGRTGGNAAFY